MNDAPASTRTEITRDGCRIVIRHERPVGTQWLTPALARQMAAALIHLANEADGFAAESMAEN